ncbi:MAG: GntR family transcriptional regulator [Phycisphaerales bacterium]
MPGLEGLDPVAAKPGTPLYQAVRDSVHDLIEQGRLAPGDRLPSTKVLSQQLEVSLVTVHRALNELVASGVLRRGQGRGTFVHEDFAKPEHIAGDLRFGLVFQKESTLADPYHGRVLQGVRDTAAELGIDLVLLRYGEDWRKECSGFLYVNPFPEQLERRPQFGGGATSKKKARDRAPVVAIGAGTRDDRSVVGVDTDNVGMMADAVALLARHGHERIGYVGDQSPASNSIDRERGFRAGCASCDLELDESLILLTRGWTLEESGTQRLTEMLARPDRPTAVVAGGYYLALDVYTAAKKAGLRIPEDLSVTGVDDPPSAAHLSPPMTTFAQPLEELGRDAVKVLSDWVRDPEGLNVPRPRRAALRERESVGPVPREIRRGGGAS